MSGPQLIPLFAALALLSACASDDAAPQDGSTTASTDPTTTDAPGPTTASGSTSGSTSTSPGSSTTDADPSSSSTAADTLTSSTTDAAESSSSSSGGDELFPDGLECTSVSLCSTYDADPSAPPFPDRPGGVLEDGLYRAVQGTSEPFGLAIAGDRYALIFENLNTSYGELSVSGTVMTQTQTNACSSNGVFDVEPPQTFDFAFWTDGTELFTYSGCDSLNPDVCGSGTRYVRVNALCEDLDSLGCDGDCECHAFADEIPAMVDGCAF